MAIATINPATGETLKTFPALTDAEVEQKLRRAADAYAHQRRTSFADRAQKILRAADILDAEKHDLARVMTLEVGKTYLSSVQEVEKCVFCCRYYAENAEKFLAEEVIRVEGARASVQYHPLGAVLAIMPWNFPLWQVFRFAVPTLMAGNVGLLKHADSVPQCALLIEDILCRAGFLPGAFQTLLIETSQVAGILDDPRVVAITLTGSEAAGSAVAERAGKRLKKAVLELGGSDPFIVMPSAHLDDAVKTAVKARTINNGQSCIAAKRFIISESIFEEFESRFVQAMAALQVGDPMDEKTDVGPLAAARLLDRLEAQVRESVAAGARILTGGERLDRPGNFYPPTVLTDIPLNSPAYYDELFGPVALLFRVPDIDAAIRLANVTTFGLGCSVWTNNPDEQARFVDDIECGMLFVNGMVASDPRIPFGGIKRSGFGRELSANGLREFVNIKTVWVRDGGSLVNNTSDTE